MADAVAQAGTKIGRFTVERAIGEGAMSTVFAAWDPLLERRVAIKVLRNEVRADRQYVARFREDGLAAGRLNHPNIVSVLDIGNPDDTPYIVMELIEGASLERILQERGRLEISEAARIARDVASALSAAHASGIIHRDVKPSNILVDKKTGVVKLTDFGAAKRDRGDEQALSVHGQLIGTPRYMAPEQINAEDVDARTDLFALGSVLYEMLAGRPAFNAGNLTGLFRAITTENLPDVTGSRPDVAPELADLIRRLLEKTKENRPESASEVAETLLPFTVPPKVEKPSERPKAADPAPKPKEKAKPKDQEKRASGKPGPWVPLAAAAAVGVVVVGGGAWWYMQQRDETATAASVSQPAATSTGAAQPSTGAAQPSTGAGQPPIEEAAASATGGETAAAANSSVDTGSSPPGTTETGDTTVAALPPGEVERQETPATVTPQIDMAALDEALAGVPCGAITANVMPSGTVTLNGTVANDQLATHATDVASQIAGVGTIESSLRIVSAPACEAAAAVELAAADTRLPTAPELVLNEPSGVYLDGDFLVLNVGMPENQGGYVYVDVMTDAGSVVHLLPDNLGPSNKLAAGGKVRIGVEKNERKEGVRDWQVAPPFGPAYVVVMTSEQPLYEGEREIEEPLDQYLDALLPALRDPASGEKGIRVQRIEFRERT